MDFLPDADQDALIEATREYIDSRFPLVDALARLDDVRWKEIAALGWLGLAADEQSGGGGATLLDEVFVFREIGRGLVCGPILTTLAAARLAAWTGRHHLARSLIAGERRVSRALPLPGATGRLLLLDADESQLTLLIEHDRAVLCPTPPFAEIHSGLEDGTLVAQVERSAFGDPLAGAHDGTTTSRLRRVLTVLAAAQLAGIAGATKDLATAYAKERVQFGKPIGSFQAIKHKCADMATNALAADNVTYFAALSDSGYHALSAAATTRRVAFSNARANIQIHGAMGFTVEDGAHRFLKRVHTLSATEGFDHAAQQLGGLPGTKTSEGA